jgi:hypothetical protein
MQREYDTNKDINRQAKPNIEKYVRIIEDEIKYKEKGYTQKVHLPVPYPFHYL